MIRNKTTIYLLLHYFTQVLKVYSLKKIMKYELADNSVGIYFLIRKLEVKMSK